MVKPRIGQHIKEKILRSPKGSSRSSDIDFLTGQFKQLKQKIKSLIDALKAQHVSLLKMNESRYMVAKRVAALAHESPIASEAGTIPMDDDEPNLKDLNSYMMVHHNLNIRQRLYCDRFADHVLTYAVDWEKVVVSRITASLTQAERLRRDLDHYQSKVDKINNEKTKIITKGMSVDEQLLAKLARNQAKLVSSRQQYENYASELSAFMTEVTARCWKDLYPILLKLTQFDATLASDESNLLSSLNQVTHNLKKVGERFGVRPESRLLDLETMSAQVMMNNSTGGNLITEGVSPTKSMQKNDAVIQDVISNLENEEIKQRSSNKPRNSSRLRLGRKKSSRMRERDSSRLQKETRKEEQYHVPQKEFTGKAKQMNDQNENDPYQMEKTVSRPKVKNESDPYQMERTTSRPKIKKDGDYKLSSRKRSGSRHRSRSNQDENQMPQDIATYKSAFKDAADLQHVSRSDSSYERYDARKKSLLSHSGSSSKIDYGRTRLVEQYHQRHELVASSGTHDNDKGWRCFET